MSDVLWAVVIVLVIVGVVLLVRGTRGNRYW